MEKILLSFSFRRTRNSLFWDFITVEKPQVGKVKIGLVIKHIEFADIQSIKAGFTGVENRLVVKHMVNLMGKYWVRLSLTTRWR